MKTAQLVTLSLAAMAVAIVVSPANASLNFASFDSPFSAADIEPYGTPLVDTWGAENAAPVGPDVGLGISPLTGDQMLRIESDASATTSFGQLVGVEHLAFSTDVGLTTATIFAYFNSPTAQPSASGEIFLEFFDAGGLLISSSVIIDVTDPGSAPTTWVETFASDILLPVGTRRVRANYEFDTASLNGLPIFADKFTLLFVRNPIPEPTGVVLAAGCLAAAFQGRRRR